MSLMKEVEKLKQEMEREKVLESTAATGWDDLRVAASVAKVGSAAPSYAAFGPSGGLLALTFEAAKLQDVVFEVQMPHAWKEGSAIYPHVHWSPVNATAGNVVWNLEYSWANMGDAFGAPVTLSTTGNAAGGTAWVHMLSRLTTSDGLEYVDATGKTLSSMIMCRLYRNATTGLDTLNANVALLEFDIHYLVDSLGSRTETVK